MKTVRTLALLATILFVVFLPSLALGQESAPAGETVIIPPAPPPVMSKAEWAALVALGASYVFMGVELAKKNFPKLTGWWVWLSVLPITAAVALYQVGIADPKLLAKHAGLLLLTAVGTRAALYKLLAKAAEAIVALLKGNTIPPPPFEPGAPPSQGPTSLPPVVPPAPRAPEMGGNLLRSRFGAKVLAAPGAAAGIVLLTAALGLVGLSGCSREAFLSRAVPVADTLEGQVRTLGKPVERDCEVPMQRAADTNDKSAARTIAARCDEPVAAYEAGYDIHVGLTGLIMQVYAGGDIGAGAALIEKAIAAGVRIAAATKALRGSK